MYEQTIPVFIDEKSSASSQYGVSLQGVRNAAARGNLRIRLISEKHIETVAYDELPPVAIVMGVSMPFMQHVIEGLRAHGRSTVLAGTDPERFGHDISCATPSRRAETQQLLHYLYFNCGKKRIALVGFGSNSINDNIRYQAALRYGAADRRRLTDSDVWQWTEDPVESFEHFAAVRDRYDAAICPNDVIAVCLIDHLRARGVSVPDDLYVASFGNRAVGRYHIPAVTTMTMDMQTVGEQAFQVWRFLMKNERRQETTLRITVPSRLLIRESTAYTRMKAGAYAPAVPDSDPFYHNPTIAVLERIENCIRQRDGIDMRILCALMDAKSYEQISDELFISGSTLRYRLNKIYADAGVKGRQAFEKLIRAHLGGGNPFLSREDASDPS